MIDDPLTEYRMKALINPHNQNGLINTGFSSFIKIPQTLSFILKMLPKRPLLAGWFFEDNALKTAVKKACEASDAKHLLPLFEEFWSEKVVWPRKSLSDAIFDFEYPSFALNIL